MSDYGKVTFNGKDYTLTQQPYVDGYDNNVRYYASAVDANGEEYKVAWKVKSNIDINEIEDESDACDWDKPVDVKKI